MDFHFNEEQRMLKESARDFLSDNCSSDFVRRMEEDELGYSPQLWAQMAELGWMGLLLPEKYGGIGWGFLDLAVMMEEIGRACLPGPFLSTTLGAKAVLAGGGEDLKAELLPKVASGELVMALALQEAGVAQYEPLCVETSAVPDGEGWRLSGGKLFVTDARTADYFIVSARSAGEAYDPEGICLFAIPAGSEGISLTQLKTIAGDKQYQVDLDGVAAPAGNLLGTAGQGWAILERLLKIGAVAKSAEMVGGSAKVLEMMVEYAKERSQFGCLIGHFQAVQHHCANMLMDLQGSRFITYKAAWMLDEDLPCDLVVASAKAWCSDAYRRVVGLGHQIGAATAYIVEHDMTLYSRRAKAAELAFGDATYHRELAAQAMGL